VDYLHNPPPPHLALARRLHGEGTVILKVRVDAQGLPHEVQVDRSSGHDILDQAAAGTVHGWRFFARRREMIAVEEWVRVLIAFRLER
jgi:protein TonB